ncbi:MAG: EscU/YscU/HrcU family type III secretion system export apparatus switch protein [Planctomycetota bacterium]
MADESEGDKTEQPSPQRREEAVKEGRFAESQDLSAACQLMLGLGLVSYFGAQVLNSQSGFMRMIFAKLGDAPLRRFDTETYAPLVIQALTPAILAAGVMTLGSVACGVGQIGPQFNMDWLSPKFDRLNPMSGFKEIASRDALIGLVIGVLKLGVIGWSAYSFIMTISVEAPQWSSLPPALMATKTVAHVFTLAWRISFLLLMLACADYGYKRWTFEQSLRVTREEAREEQKQQDGDPKVKQHIRQLQRQRATQHMMRDVPKATVVIANPTHVAIALRYEAGEGRAPVVLAKGEHLVAQRIKAVAAEHGIPVLEEPPLARALLRAVDVGQEIPVEFYRAVAAILAQLYKRKTAPVGGRLA